MVQVECVDAEKHHEAHNLDSYRYCTSFIPYEPGTAGRQIKGQNDGNDSSSVYGNPGLTSNLAWGPTNQSARWIYMMDGAAPGSITWEERPTSAVQRGERYAE